MGADAFEPFPRAGRVRFRDGEVHLTAGEMIVVPRGVEHLPVSGPHGASVMLVEPASKNVCAKVSTAHLAMNVEPVSTALSMPLTTT